MALTLTDTHCHLDQPPLMDAVPEVLARANFAGVRRCITIGTSLATSQANVAIAERFDNLRVAVGVHPHEADQVDDATMRSLEVLAQQRVVVAIGEIGLDFYRMHSPRAEQMRVAREMFALSERCHLPLVIHCRQAEDAFLELLDECGPRPLRGVMHCASGSASFIQETQRRGFYISFAGNVTFSKARDLQELVACVPEERLLIETDAPYLSPEPLRGKSNEPAHLTHTASFLARLRGISLEQLAEVTTRNAQTLFGLEST